MAFDWRILVFGGLVALVGAYTFSQMASAPPPPAASVAPASPVASVSAREVDPVEAAVVNSTPEPSATAVQKFAAHTPAGRLETYVQGDFIGERLEGANWATKYKAMVNWATEPSWDNFYIIRNYNIESGKTDTQRATAMVTYDTLGEFDLELYKYNPSPTRQTVTFTLEKEKDTWLLAYPTLRPHVGMDAAIAHLERLAVGYPLKKPAIDEGLKQLRAEKARLKL